MESYISYVAGGQTYKLSTNLTFKAEGKDQDYIAAQVFLQVSRDRDEKLISGIIRRDLSEEEKKGMSDKDIEEWRKTSDIEFFDALSGKKLKMKHMSDFMGRYVIEDNY